MRGKMMGQNGGLIQKGRQRIIIRLLLFTWKLDTDILRCDMMIELDGKQERIQTGTCQDHVMNSIGKQMSGSGGR